MAPIRNDTDRTVWCELCDESGTPLLLDEVVDDVVYLRHMDRSDTPEGRIRVEPGQRVVVTTPIGAIGLNASGDAGANDLLFQLRVVPDGRANGVVYGRTLLHGEADDGRRVHVRPGESFTLAKGAVTVALDAIDDYYRNVDHERPQGSLATALRVWFGIDPGANTEMHRLTTAAAYRLDAAEHLLRRAHSIRSAMPDENNLTGPQLVAKADELIHLVQEGIVALARCIAIVKRGIRTSSFAVEQQAAIELHDASIKAIRDAYEHIDERAFGKVGRKRDDERATMIFDHNLLVQDGIIEYLEHRLDITQLPHVLEACRTAIKALAGGPPGHLAPPTREVQ